MRSVDCFVTKHRNPVGTPIAYDKDDDLDWIVKLVWTVGCAFLLGDERNVHLSRSNPRENLRKFKCMVSVMLRPLVFREKRPISCGIYLIVYYLLQVRSGPILLPFQIWLLTVAVEHTKLITKFENHFNSNQQSSYQDWPTTYIPHHMLPCI